MNQTQERLLILLSYAQADHGTGSTDAVSDYGAWARETILLNSPWPSTHKAPNPNLVLFFGRKRWHEKISLVLSRVFPSRKMIAALYPVPANSLRVFLYYPMLFLTLFKRNLTGFRDLLSGTAQGSSAHNNAVVLMDWLFTRK